MAPSTDPADGAAVGDIVVVRAGDLYAARPVWSDERLFDSADAATVINRAIERVARSGGGRVQLTSGVYDLASPLRLLSHVTLSGAGRGTRLRVTRANAEGIGVIGLGVDRPELRDFVVLPQVEHEAVAGVVLDRCGQPHASGVEAAGFGRFGFWVRNECFLPTLRDCIATENAAAGFFVDEHQRGPRGNFPPVSLRGCSAVGGGVGFDIHKSTVVNVVGCAVHQSRGVGFHIHNWSCSVLLSGCRTFQVGSHAILAELANELNLTGNIFCWHESDGVVVRETAWGVISGNEVIDSGSVNPGGPDETFPMKDLPPQTPHGTAIVLQRVRGFSVTGNTLFNWSQGRRLEHAIVEDAACRQNLIANNVMNYLRAEAVVSAADRSEHRGNVVEAHEPFQGPTERTWMQSYQPELTRQYVREAILRPIRGAARD